MWAILRFLLFNCAFSLSDVLTDLLSYFNLLDDGHVWWASLTMYWMWNAFVLHTLLYLWNKMRGKREVCCVELIIVHYGRGGLIDPQLPETAPRNVWEQQPSPVLSNCGSISPNYGINYVSCEKTCTVKVWFDPKIFSIHNNWFSQIFQLVCKTYSDLPAQFYQEAGKHVPFMSCAHNVWRARRLYQLNYGTAEFNSRDHKEVEQIFDEVGRCAQTETNLEAGPQSVTQVRPILMYFRAPCSYSKSY